MHLLAGGQSHFAILHLHHLRDHGRYAVHELDGNKHTRLTFGRRLIRTREREYHL